jgi:hypothetical protein
MFQLTNEEYRSLRRQFGTLKRGAHPKYPPNEFTSKVQQCCHQSLAIFALRMAQTAKCEYYDFKLFFNAMRFASW